MIILPLPFAAVAAAHVGAADRGFSQKPGPQEVSGSHSTLCHGPPCTCEESAGNLPYPAGRGGEKDGLVISRVRGDERRVYREGGSQKRNCTERNIIKELESKYSVFVLSLIFV